MLYAIIIVVLMLIIFGAVFIHKAIQQREMTQKKRANTLRKLKISLLELDDIVQTLRTYHGYGPMLHALTTFQIFEYENILRKFPEDDESKNYIQELKAFELTIDEAYGKNFTPEIPQNDRQITIFKRNGLRALKILRQVAAKGIITELEYSDYNINLKTKLLRSEVDAFVNQGTKAENNADHMSAAQYFKHAKDLLLSSDITYDTKTQDIKSISRMISGIYSSGELSPEAATAEAKTDESEPK